MKWLKIQSSPLRKFRDYRLGDEMNIHIAQSIQARNELKRIANVKYQIIGAKDSNPIIGCVQDALSGCYLLTKLNNKIPGSVVSNFLCNTSSENKYDIDPNKLYTGHEIFSYIIPEGINNTIIKNEKVVFEIINGELINGTLDKSTLSTVKNSIIHFIWDKYGSDKTRRFIDDAQRLAIEFLNYRGFTMGIGDCIPKPEIDTQVQELITSKILEYKTLLTQYENDTEQINTSIVENNLSSELTSFSTNISQILMQSLNPSNNLFVCANSGSKGSPMNLQHIMGCLGQKMIEGTRIKKKVENRTLPIFHKDDDTPEARGFIKSSFYNGLQSFEFFYDAMAGREGLIDTAIKSVTWETPIVIIENGEPKYTEIGKWIDNVIETNKDKVEHFEERQMELLDVNNIYIPTTDYKGNVSWGSVTAVTRHDPGVQLYEIKTSGGRSVTVTESKSLLVWNNETNEFKEKLTPEIKVGDFVPVTLNLCQPPIIKTYIELSNYLSKKEYIYGTDYHKTTMVNRSKIPCGWWDESNGKDFTLPYTKKSSLQRCLIRSNQENICVYPYAAKRSKANISDKFDLNYDNGIFIGLFLSEGSISGESIRITNNNENIKLFVKSWFDKQSIEWNEEIKINKIGGLSTSIRGNTAILTRFLTKLVGKGAENKYVPNEAFIAPETFIIGLLNGYFSGDGCITKNSIDASSASKRLIEGINMLCSRLGIFSKTYVTQLKSNNLGTVNIKPSYRLRISAQWAKMFSEKITLIEDVRNKKMKEKVWSLSHKNFKEFNNVVLDPITEINLIDVKDHPKVYDLTIPSTFNFGLANGLQVRDTAKTGYIQRQLIKGLEDLVIKYDNTNRNSKNVIIQYVYGENGIEQSNQTELTIGLISLNNEELDNVFGFDKTEISKLEKEHKIKNLEAFNKTYVAKIKGYRNKLRNIQAIANNNYKTLEEKYMLPVNLFRLTQDYSKNKVNLELTPQEIDSAIDELLNSSDTRLLAGVKDSHKYLVKDDRLLKFLFEIALHDYLCPKKCIYKYGLSKVEFKKLINDIKINFIKALVQPGEMVGIIAAQSIGEPTSQMSQMGNHRNKIIIKNKFSNEIIMVSPEVGPFCDEIIKNNLDVTYGTGHVNSVETDLTSLDNEYYIVGVDTKEKTHWNKISHVSRHPVNGQVMKVTTKSGRSVHTTTSHSHLIRKNQSVVPIVGSDMTVGMRIPVAKHIDNPFVNDTIDIEGQTFKLDYLFGWFIGAYLADYDEEFIIDKTKIYLFLKNVCGEGITKKIPDFAFLASNEFKVGLIQAYIDGDGEFQDHQIIISNQSEQLIKDMALLLSYFDMFGSIMLNLSNNYDLKISAKYSALYKQHIGSILFLDELDQLVEFSNKHQYDDIDEINGLGEIIEKCNNITKSECCEIVEPIGRRTLEKYIQIFEAHENVRQITEELSILKQAANSNVIWDEVVDIEIYDVDPSTFVYDFTVPGNQTFMIDNGIIIHNTLNTKHSAGSATKNIANSGVGRIEELLHYSKNIKTPIMTLRFDNNICNDRSKVNKISSYLTHLSIKELIVSAEIYYDVGSNDELSKIIKNDKVSNPFFINNQKADLNLLPFVFRIKLNMEKMHDKETTLLDIKTKFISHWQKNFSNLKNMKKNEKDIFSKISRCAILSNTDIINQIIHVRFNMSSFNYNLLTDFLKIILNNITLKGIDNIDNSIMINERKLSFDESTGNSVVDKEYIVYTEGINMQKIKYIKGINLQLSSCNDISTMYKLYGIEAARQVLINEFNETFNAGGTKSINHNHMTVLIDMMTHMGTITSIDRHGLGKVDSEPFAKASFEKTMDHFLNAAIFNETDHIKSVSARIMLGRVIPGGTGAFELLLDTDKLENSEYTNNENGGRVTFPALEEESLFTDIMKYGFSKNDFFLPV